MPHHKIVQKIDQLLDQVYQDGQTHQYFMKLLKPIVEDSAFSQTLGLGEKHSWHARTSFLYCESLRVRYAKSRREQLKEANFAWLVYSSDCDTHLELDGLTLKSDHQFWVNHIPPNDWECSCYLTGTRSLQAAMRRGGTSNTNAPAESHSPQSPFVDPAFRLNKLPTTLEIIEAIEAEVIL